MTTLFPHLPGHRVHEFRWGLVGGLGVISLLVISGQFTAAVITAAVLVPVLYLVYLYEAQVYRDEPVRVVSLTIVTGAALGAAVTLIANRLIAVSPSLTQPTATGTLLRATVLLPFVQEFVKPLPVLLLRRSPAFNETIDGLTFGVATGLGFAAAQTIVNFSRIIQHGPAHTNAGAWLAPVLAVAVLNPLLQGSATGLVAASLWRGPAQRRSDLYRGGLVVALLAHVAFAVGSQLLADHGGGVMAAVIWQGVVVAALLVAVRVVVHRALLDEAVDFGLTDVTCPSCRHETAAAAFCPTCGGAISAGPRTPSGSRLVSEKAPPAAP